MVLYILNRDEELMTVLHNDSELDGIQQCDLVEDLSEISTLNFEVSGDTEGLEHLQEECQVLTQNLAGKWKLFTVKHITDIHNIATCKRVEAEDVITELGDYVVGTNYQGKTIEPKKVVADLLKGTGFAVGEVSGDFLSTTIDVDTRYMSKLALLQHIASLGNAYLFTDINIEGTEIVSVTVSIKQANKDIGRRFEFDSELVELQKENDSTTIKTAILPLGAVKEQTAEEQEAGVPAEYVKITDVSWTTSAGKPVDKPAGQDYIEDVEATAKYGNTASDGTKKPRVVVMQFSEITDPEVLATRAYMELQALTAPRTNYSFSANDLSGYLATQDIMDEPVEVGDVCYVIDNSVNPPIVEEVIVRRIAGNPDRPEALNIEIGTPQATLVDSDITGSGLNHYGAGGSSSNNGSFVSITANTANIDTLKVRNAQVLNQLDSDRINVETISGTTASFDTLIVDSLNVTEALMNKANVADLHAINATINTLKADVAYVTDLNVVTGKVEALEGKTATFENILAGNITADNIQAGAITAGSGVIADGAIGSAQISDLDASKLTAGTIDTTKVEIAGADGHLQLKGNRLQVFQGTGGNAVERVSLGDVNNDGSVYGLRVRGADGVTVLLDENGVKSEGITDGSITNDKISGDANIDGSKLNINSVITEINEEGTTTIAGNKITVDGTTLDTKLYTITEAQDDMSSTIEQHSTSISANEKAIKAKVDSQTYTADMQGLNSKLNKNTTAISALQGEIALKVEQSDIETAKDDMGQIIDSKIADAKASIKVTTDGISQSVSNLNKVVSNKADGSTVTAIDNKVASLNTTLNGISGKVSKLETTTTTLGNNVNGLQGSVNTLDQSVASLQLTTEGMSSTVNTLKTNQQTLTQKVTSVEGAVSTVERNLSTTSNKVSTMENNLDSITQRVATTETATTTLNSKIDGIQIGGRNLLRNTSLDGITFPYSGSDYNWRTASTNDGAGISRTKVAITDNNSFSETIYGIKVVNTTSATGNCDIAQDNVKMEDGATYTMSAYFKVTSGNPTWRLQYGTKPYPVKTGTAKSGWNKYSYTFKYDKTQFSNKLTTNIYFGFVGANFEGYICGFKLEKGNKATDWSPAPADTTADLNKKANSADVYKKAETYTKTETDSAIKVAKDEINLGVKNTYETKANVETKVNNAVNNIQIGGRNIATHTNQGTTGWAWGMKVGGATISEVTENGIRCCKMVRDKTAQSGWCYISYNKIGREKYLPSKQYTISFEVKSSVVTDFWCSLREGNGSEPLCVSNAKATVSKANTWTKLSFTLTTVGTLPTSKAQVIYLNSMNAGTGVTYIFRNLMIEEGTKASSWSPAPEDVDSAINSKANSSDVYKKSETYTKSETDSAIKVAKDQISLNVSNTYETKANVETKVNTAVNNIQIGGRNLISPAKVQAYTQYNTVKPNNANGWTITKKETAKSVAIKQSDFTPEVGKTYTFSGYATVNGQPVSEGFFSSSRLNTYLQPADRIVVNNGYFEVVQHWNTSSVWILHCVLAGVVDGAVVDFSNLMLEEGNKASAYTKNPNDVDEVINSKANSADVYKKTEVYTKSETTSQINVAKDSITNTVSQNYVTKSDATNTYATKSSLTQTTNSIVAKFEGSGGYNLIKNSSGVGGTSLWTISSGATIAVGSSPNTGSNVAQFLYLDNGTNTTERFAHSSRFKLKPKTKYTLTGYFNNHTKCPTFDVHVLMSTDVDETNTGLGFTSSALLLSQQNTGGVWKKYKATFTTPASVKSGILRIDNNGYNANGSGSNRVHWNALMLVEGELEMPWSPHPDEVYNGSTVIDATGLTVNNGAIKVKNKAGATVLSGDSNGNLTLSGTIKSDAGNGQYVAVNSGGITFRDSQKSEEVLRLNTSYSTSNRDINGVTFAMPQYSDYLSFRYIAKPSLETGWDGSVTRYSFMDMWSTDFNDASGNKQYKGVNVYAPMYMSQRIRFRNGGDPYLHEITPNITWNTMDKLMGVYGDNGTVIGYKSGDNLQARIVVTEGNHPNTADVIKSWGHWNCSGAIVHNATFRGSFVNSYANTETRTVSNTAGVMAEGNQVRVNFENVQIKDGKAILSIPKRYKGINDGYIVNAIVKKGRGDVWVAQEHEDRFTIEGEHDIAINVEVIIKLTEAVVAKTVREDEQLCIEVPNGETSSAI